MTLPLVISPGDPGHIGDHEEIHLLLGSIDGQTDWKATAWRDGTLAARPAAGASNEGLFYYSTDTFELFYSDGTTWNTQVLANRENTFTAVNNFEADTFFSAGRPWADPMSAQFGAVGDDATDATGAFQDTLDFLDATFGGGILHVSQPEVAYRFSQTDGLEGTDNIEIVGPGLGCRLRFDALTLANAAVRFVARSKVAVRHLTIESTTSLNQNQHGVLLEDCTDAEVEEVAVDSLDRGFWCTNTGSTYSVNNNIDIVRCTATNTYGYGFHFMRAFDCRWDHCKADGARSQDGFKTVGECKSLTITGCRSSNNHRDGMDFMDGLIESTVSNNRCFDNTLEGLDIKGTVGGVNNTATDFVVRRTTFTGNICTGNGDAGMHITDVRDLSFSGNLAVGNNVGWQLTRVERCTFSSDHGDFNDLYGWSLNQAVKHNAFGTCTGHNNAVGNAGYDGWRIQVQSTGSSDDNVFEGCQANKSSNRTVTDGVTNGTTTVTSASAAFTDVDVGKPISISGAGVAGATWYSVIISRTNSTTIVIEAAPPTNVTGATLNIGELDAGTSLQDRGFNFVTGRCNRNMVIGCQALNNITGGFGLGGTVIADNYIVSYQDDNGFFGAKFQKTGATSVADGGTVTHGLGTTPTSVRVTPTTSGEFVSVTAKSSTTFTVAIKKHDGTAGTTQTVYWEANV